MARPYRDTTLRNGGREMTMAVFEKLLLTTIVAFCAYLLWATTGIRAPARMFPLTIAIFTGGMALYALIRSFSRPLDIAFFQDGRGIVVMTTAVGLAVHATAMAVNYLVATFVLLLAGYVFLMPERTGRGLFWAVIVAISVTALTWLCFSLWLGVNLPT